MNARRERRRLRNLSACSTQRFNGADLSSVVFFSARPTSEIRSRYCMHISHVYLFVYNVVYGTSVIRNTWQKTKKLYSILTPNSDDPESREYDGRLSMPATGRSDFNFSAPLTLGQKHLPAFFVPLCCFSCLGCCVVGSLRLRMPPGSTTSLPRI